MHAELRERVRPTLTTGRVRSRARVLAPWVRASDSLLGRHARGLGDEGRDAIDVLAVGVEVAGVVVVSQLGARQARAIAPRPARPGGLAGHVGRRQAYIAASPRPPHRGPTPLPTASRAVSRFADTAIGPWAAYHSTGADVTGPLLGKGLPLGRVWVEEWPRLVTPAP
jgi:hypothetical protein